LTLQTQHVQAATHRESEALLLTTENTALRLNVDAAQQELIAQREVGADDVEKEKMRAAEVLTAQLAKAQADIRQLVEMNSLLEHGGIGDVERAQESQHPQVVQRLAELRRHEALDTYHARRQITRRLVAALLLLLGGIGAVCTLGWSVAGTDQQRQAAHVIRLHGDVGTSRPERVACSKLLLDLTSLFALVWLLHHERRGTLAPYSAWMARLKSALRATMEQQRERYIERRRAFGLPREVHAQRSRVRRWWLFGSSVPKSSYVHPAVVPADLFAPAGLDAVPVPNFCHDRDSGGGERGELNAVEKLEMDFYSAEAEENLSGCHEKARTLGELEQMQTLMVLLEQHGFVTTLEEAARVSTEIVACDAAAQECGGHAKQVAMGATAILLLVWVGVDVFDIAQTLSDNSTAGVPGSAVGGGVACATVDDKVDGSLLLRSTSAAAIAVAALTIAALSVAGAVTQLVRAATIRPVYPRVPKWRPKIHVLNHIVERGIRLAICTYDMKQERVQVQNLGYVSLLPLEIL
jgi:hypothetical protein